MENHLQRVMRKCRNQQERLRIQKARLRKQQVRLLEARVERVGGDTPCHAGVVTGKTESDLSWEESSGTNPTGAGRGSVIFHFRNRIGKRAL